MLPTLSSMIASQGNPCHGYVWLTVCSVAELTAAYGLVRLGSDDDEAKATRCLTEEGERAVEGSECDERKRDLKRRRKEPSATATDP